MVVPPPGQVTGEDDLIGWRNRKVPVVLQAERHECGLACVAMILASHGCHISMRELRSKANPAKMLSLKELTNLFNDHGLFTRSLRCEPAELRDLQLPIILHVDMNHYVVLESAHRFGLEVVDPGIGRVSLSWEKLSRRFTGVVLEPCLGSSFAQSGKETRHTIWPLPSGLPSSEFKASFAAVVVLSLLIQLLALATPFYLQVMIDEVLMVNNLEMATVVVSAFLLVYLVSTATQFLRGILVLVVGTRLSFMLSAGMMRRVLGISLPYFRARTVGDIASRFGSLQPVQLFLTENMARMFVDLLMVLTTTIMLLCFSIKIALLVIAASALYLCIQYVLLQPYRRHQLEYLITEADLQTHFIESIRAIETTRHYEAIEQQLQDFLGRTADSLNAALNARKWVLVSEITQYLLTGVIAVFVVAIAVQDVTRSAITLGMLYTLTAYSSHLTSAMVSLTAGFQSYLLLSLHAQRLSDLIEAEQDDRTPVKLIGPLTSLECRNITYQRGSRTVLNKVSFHLTAPNSLAVLGASGSGKSTLLSIIMGDLTASEGSVWINGQQLLSSQNPTGVMSSLLPTDQLTRGSVLGNITYLDIRPDQNRSVRAAIICGIHEHIMMLPLGYQERLSEEDCPLSTGQKQRLLLARALCRRTRLLILDEATSHLDEQSEIELMNRILTLPRMCVYVTHRESVARLAHRVIRLDELGDHPPLSACPSPDGVSGERVSGNTSASHNTAIANPMAR